MSKAGRSLANGEVCLKFMVMAKIARDVRVDYIELELAIGPIIFAV